MRNENDNKIESEMSVEKKKSGMGWPIGIIIGYVIFVGSTLAFVFYAFTVPVNLEKDDYYESTLRYQDQIDREARTMALVAGSVGYEFSSDRSHVHVQFPGEHVVNGITGRIHLFRPSDFRLDRELAVAPDSSGLQAVPVLGLQRGHWIIKVQWDAGGTEYYWQRELNL
jgi:nitrogen fixation protein FixH